ncbi:MAG: hypothetical protein ABF483_01550 [Liquorilactobacillus nagelii]|uniref:Uncharacterized protein n=1 Tax=Liquorilactobacillus nagelii TaxID=82688 RepID=A0A3S6QZC0_9LACO|nr:hypothetical protein [Liquorilactobacillus nagelii]AUJ31545.1 hypothetical protein BSQ50_02610 [Liquorilactobacillus nagelii]MCC7616096.1 hypothetical protein [Liquorilactobacillus nagelii]MCI1633258.1 hypothetical protein [Liquorilactobacillus nagelii]MCI1699663.1 hypothetical protein [Liquorilactobacillus nagelii]MCI1921771.1 hypothetical protein [Liquorilactobacillus nagelii]
MKQNHSIRKNMSILFIAVMLLAIGGSIGYSLGLKSSQTRLTKNINRPKMTNSKSPQKQPFKNKSK